MATMKRAMIPLVKPVISQAEKQKVLEVLETGMLASGSYVKEYERRFSRFIGTRYGVATSSGTSALHVALLSLGIGKGDEVITTPFSFIATSNAILYCQARPVFADVELDTFNISPPQIEKALETHPKAKALLIAHIFGLPCQMDEISKLARRHRIKLIEDCAQATGAEWDGKKVGVFGDVAVFSFYATKNMITGEGGMILTNDKQMELRSRALINHGRSSRFIHTTLGYNYRTTNLAAAIGLCQLQKINRLNAKRAQNAKYLSRHLNGTKGIILPYKPERSKHVFHLYTMKVKGKRNQLIRHLAKEGIESASIYPIPIHKQPLYKRLGYGRLKLPKAEAAAREVVSIPVHPSLKKSDLQRIVKAIRKWAKATGRRLNL